MDDKPSARPSIERKREWAHGDGGKGQNCDRAKDLIYTAPQSVPTVCRDWTCDNGEWFSKGIVQRTKGDKKIVHREA